MSLYLKIWREGGVGLLFRLIFGSMKEAKKYSLIPQLNQVLRIKMCFFLARHHDIECSSQNMISKGSLYGYFYLGRSLFLQARYPQAKKEVSRFVNQHPTHEDSIYLLVEILKKLGEIKEAWSYLNFLALNTSRLKTWSVLANMINTPQEYRRFQEIYRRALSFGLVPEVGTSLSLTRYFSNAALRVGDEEQVKCLWRALYKHKQAHGHSAATTGNKVYFSTNTATRVLFDLKNICDLEHINYFLVSGTLLGCIREGQLLSHDKDIDVGIWSTENVTGLLDRIAQSGQFYILESRSPHLILLRHTSGISVDVFIHYVENSCWHSGVKIRWHNTPFFLVERMFLGDKFLIPNNYEQYLEENYGDWKRPKISFDSALDTTNAEVISDIEMLAYLYGQLLAKPEDDVRYREKLLVMGESLNSY